MHLSQQLMVGILLLCLCGRCSPTFAQGYSPDEAAGRMAVADGFRVDLVAAEPFVRQPVAIDFDDRGRLWVIQYLQYPNPAGLRRVKVDRYSRTTYDRVPQPPPHGPRGADRISILEDRDGDGRVDHATDFVSGLNLTTGFAFGHGGVFVLNVPYLLFYPDRNRDDIPDGDPEVLLEGFGMEDSSSLANSLMFGPDGWLYGTQGTNIRANIRGVEFEQGVWRYHPVTHEFELFAEGGGNSWGLDFDAAGRLLFSTNYGGYIFDHALQGAYFHKTFGKHGELHNPYAFGYLEAVPHEDFTGGHVTVGGLVYDGASFPSQFRGKFVGADLLEHKLYWHRYEADGSTLRSSHGGTLLDAHDSWFAASDVTQGPDGAIYIADWHDQRTAHPDPDADWDRRNGRIYRLQAADAPPVRSLDLHDLTSEELVDLLGDPNGWYVARARRILGERRDGHVVPRLRTMLEEANDVQTSREALWTLASMDAFDQTIAEPLLDHRDETIRMWTVRLLGDRGDVSQPTAAKFLQMARADESDRVRAQLACSAKRLPAATGIALVAALLERQADRDDRCIPLLVWWALEKHSVADIGIVLDAFATDDAWANAYTRQTILPRLMRRYAAEGTTEGFAACARLLDSAADDSADRMLLGELDAGLALIDRGRERGLPPGTLFSQFAVSDNAQNESSQPLDRVPAELAEPLGNRWKSDNRDPLLLRLMTRLGDRNAHDRAVELAVDAGRPAAERVEMLAILREFGQSSCIDDLLPLVRDGNAAEVRLAAMQTLARFAEPRISDAVLAEYVAMNEPMRAEARRLLLGRKDWAGRLLEFVDVGKISADEIAIDDVRTIAHYQDADLDALVRKHWGGIRPGTPEEKLAEMRRLTNDLRAGGGDFERGRELFKKHCAICHELFGEGNRVGPELTSANRGDRDYLLRSLVDPNAQIRKEYLSYVVVTVDGRVLTGVVVDESAGSITLADAKNRRTEIARSDIEEMKASTASLMPENVLEPLSPQNLRDLFSYLQK